MKTKKIKIAFISAKRYSFYPLDYMERGLGGTESTLVLLTEALAKLGHTVDVYNCCYKPGIYNSVNWKHIWEFDNKNENYDVVISLRLLEVFEKEIKAKIKAVWIHDETLVGATVFDQNERVNLWISVSKTQQSFIKKNESIRPENWFITRNALDENLYTKKLLEAKKIKNQIIYCSAPDRGLDTLVDMWPEIKKGVPDATLCITGSFALWGNADEENSRFFNDLYNKILKFPEIKLYGRVSKETLANLQAESEIMLYPTMFNEMFCISALECLSVGTPIISTAKAAMIERIINNKTGILLEGDASNIQFKKEFVESSISLMLDRDRLNKFAENAIKLNSKLTFIELAKDWEKEFYKRLNL